VVVEDGNDIEVRAKAAERRQAVSGGRETAARIWTIRLLQRRGDVEGSSVLPDRLRRWMKAVLSSRVA
jgi:hypothetical protein